MQAKYSVEDVKWGGHISEGEHIIQEGKDLALLLGARFMPSSHLSDVTRDRAILIICILSGKTIDVGSILHASIMHSVKGVLVGLYFPYLITVLCGKAGVI